MATDDMQGGERMMAPRVYHYNDVFLPADAVYVGRAMPRYGLAESPWHNPFSLVVARRAHPTWDLVTARAWVLREFERYARETLQRVSWHWLDPLAGRDLVCWCAKRNQPLEAAGTPGVPLVCHGQVLLRLLREQAAGQVVLT